MRIEIHQEENAMPITVKGSRYSFITVVSVCFFLSNFVFSMPLYAVGEISAWGLNENGQCNVPEPNTDFTDISAGWDFSVGLKQDSSIAAWGNNEYGQCDVPTPNTGFIAISAGAYHSLALKADGSIVAWGANWSGECDVPSPNTDFIAVSAGENHSLGLKADGSIVAWGSNLNGECDLPFPNTGFIAIAASRSFSLGLKQDGSIAAWGGYNESGECNVPSPNTDFIAIAAGWSHSLGLKQDGSIVAWGGNWFGECDVPIPNTGFVAIAAGAELSLGLKSDGSIIAWGRNFEGQCDVPQPNTGFTAIAANFWHSLGLKGVAGNVKSPIFYSDGGTYMNPVDVTMYCPTPGAVIHYTTNGVNPTESDPVYSGPINISVTTKLKARAWKTGCSPSDIMTAIYPIIVQYPLAEKIVAWGENEYGQCNVPSPNIDFNAVAGGAYFSLGLRADGSIAAWGENEDGECNVPAPNTGFTAIETGFHHSLGLKHDGSIVCWGDNWNYQCNVPSPNTNFTAVAASGYYSLGLKQNGSIVVWGDQYAVPAPNTGFKAVAAGYRNSLGLKQDGSIVAWGRNWFGECDVPSPNEDFNAVAAGHYHSLGLKTDGSIAAWGDNSFGQCSVPSPNTDFAAVAAGGDFSLGLKQDGSIVVWGKNVYGIRTVPKPNIGFTAIAAGYQFALGLKKPGTSISKCTVTAGKTRNQDAFSLSGYIEFPIDLDINSINHIDANIVSLTDGVCIYAETVNADFINGRLKYSGPSGIITSLIIDLNKKQFSIKAKKVDLTGLACPFRLELTLGDYILPSNIIYETKVNGIRTLIPTRLMRLYGDAIVVDKAKARHNSTKASSDTLSVTGDIAIEDMDLEANEPNLVTKNVVLTWGDQNGTPVKTLTIPADNGFKASRTGHVYKCSRIHPAEDPNSSITAQFDLDRCTFRVSVSNAASVFTGPADAIFGVSFDTFSETADINHITGRSW